MLLKTNLIQYENDASEIIRAFYESGSEKFLNTVITHNFDGKCNIVYINDKIYAKNSLPENYKKSEDALYIKKIEKRYMKLALYLALSSFFGRELPWGALTGVRPTKLVREIEKEDKDPLDVLINLYKVSPARANLAVQITKNQKNLILENEKIFDLYVGIPFCVSRCNYCTFISEIIGKAKNLVEPYKNTLIKELDAVKKIVSKNGYKIRSVYVGGGTPTSFPAQYLKEILMAIPFKGEEFTVEAGRPDTITEEKLDILKEAEVTRISVNPQTLNDNTLKLIGRSHTADDFFKAYEMAKKYNFIINTDLIAGLTGEDENDFLYSLKNIASLNPDNITLHTLAYKRGSVISLESTKKVLSGVKMADVLLKSGKFLNNQNYNPYYMYRQKYMMDNLENVGYAKKNRECLYNIDIMEETLGIMATGSGAISKRLYYFENRLERLANVKDVREYIKRADASFKKKEIFFKNQ